MIFLCLLKLNYISIPSLLYNGTNSASQVFLIYESLNENDNVPSGVYILKPLYSNMKSSYPHLLLSVYVYNIASS